MIPKSSIAFIGRILLVQIFFMSGANKIFHFAETEAYMAQHGMPLTSILLTITIIFQIGGALLIFLGFYTRVGVVLLLAFIIPATFIFHTDFSDQTQVILFMHNLSVMGGLLLLFANGPGNFSIDGPEI